MAIIPGKRAGRYRSAAADNLVVLHDEVNVRVCITSSGCTGRFILGGEFQNIFTVDQLGFINKRGAVKLHRVRLVIQNLDADVGCRSGVARR